MRTLFTIFMLTLLGFKLFGQDRIILWDNQEIDCWIIEKKPHTVIYRLFPGDEGPVITQRTAMIHKIVYRNGYEEVIKKEHVRFQNRFVVNGGLAIEYYEYALITLQTEFFVSPSLSIAGKLYAGDGYFSYYAGGQYYLKQRKKSPHSMFTGLLIGGFEEELSLMVPLGYNFSSSIGFDLKFVVNGGLYPGQLSRDFGYYDSTFILPELTVGWRF
jgi:hypothetical protein